jgi:hypothetical protein
MLKARDSPPQQASVAAGMNPMDLKRGIDKAVITASRTFFLDPVSRKRTPNRRKGHHRLLRRCGQPCRGAGPI